MSRLLPVYIQIGATSHTHDCLVLVLTIKHAELNILPPGLGRFNLLRSGSQLSRMRILTPQAPAYRPDRFTQTNIDPHPVCVGCSRMEIQKIRMDLENNVGSIVYTYDYSMRTNTRSIGPLRVPLKCQTRFQPSVSGHSAATLSGSTVANPKYNHCREIQQSEARRPPDHCYEIQ